MSQQATCVSSHNATLPEVRMESFSSFSQTKIPKITALLLFASLMALPALTQTPATAAQCLECHSKVTPNIVSDWKLSKHNGVDVSCVTCHGDKHTSASDVSKVNIPTPETCAQCHETQVTQFKKGKHAMAWASMK